jgi:hypothetical protein
MKEIRRLAGLAGKDVEEEFTDENMDAFEDDERVRLRRTGMKMSQMACKKESYPYNGKIVELRCVDKMVEGTRWFYHDDEIPPVRSPRAPCKTVWSSYHKEGEEVHTVALNCSDTSKVACVNLTSAYHPANGYNEGTAHTVEDAVHMRSTLPRSCEKIEDGKMSARLTVPTCARPQRPRAGGQWKCHLPLNGVLLSPHVEFFRGSRMQGYPFTGRPTPVAAVISAALPCCVEVENIQPYDRPDDEEAYMVQLHNKFTAILGAAMCAGASVLVVGDMADPMYGNDVIDVGWAFGECVRRYFPNTFAEIKTVGSKEFSAIAQASFNGEVPLEFWKSEVTGSFDALKRTIDDKQTEVEAMFRKMKAYAKKLEDDRRDLEVKAQELTQKELELKQREGRLNGFCFLCP